MGTAQQFVACQERIRQNHAAVGRIVQRALQQGVGRVVPGHAGQRGDVPGQAVHVLRVDRVALEGHRGRAHLPRPEGFAPFPNWRRLQQPQVETEAVERGCQPCQRRQHAVVLLARVDLGGDWEGIQPQFRHHASLQFGGGHPSASQQLGIGGSGAHRALDPLAPNAGPHATQFNVVLQQVLAIDRQTVADGGRLGGLEVGETHAHLAGAGLNEVGQSQKQRVQPLQQ